MSDPKTNEPEEIQKAFLEHERSVRVHNFRVACLTAFVFTPAGWSLDLFVYPDRKMEFLLMRMICSALLLFIWWFITTPLGARHERLLGLILPGLPTFFISLMIYREQGAESPYYAGLNLVLLGAVIILRWSAKESALILLQVMVVYLAACYFHGPIDGKAGRIFYNNFYFLLVTGVFIVIGSHFYNKLRFREFTLRFQLDKQFKQLQETEMQLVQTEKLASLGRLSAGIIHEINNPLNYAKTGLYMLKNKGKHIAPEQQAEYADTLKDVEEGLDRVRNIVSDLRSFSHHEDANREHLEVRELVSASLRFVSHEWRNTVQVEQGLAEHQTIWVNKNKMIQVLVNLLQNSLYAVNRKTFANGEQPTVWIESRVEKENNLVIVRDNGVGIAPKDMDKIFDPFFTTKDVGEGMGLGLSISYRIVQEYGGRILARSEPGKFCEFTLEFPNKG